MDFYAILGVDKDVNAEDLKRGKAPNSALPSWEVARREREVLCGMGHDLTFAMTDRQ